MTNTDFVILGFLHHGDFSGYDIKKLIDDSIPHFWNESYTKIYQSLKKLENAEYLYSIAVSQESKPDKKIYGITDKGKNVFEQWLHNKKAGSGSINTLLIKLFFASEKTKKDINSQLQTYLSDLDETLLMYKDYKDLISKQNASQKKVYWLLTVEYAISKNEMEIGWLKSAIKAIT